MIIKMGFEDARHIESATPLNANTENSAEPVTHTGRRENWMYIDNLQDVSVVELSEGDAYFPDNLDALIWNVGKNTNAYPRVLISATRLDKQVEIVCSFRAYLLNDSGKTIERIN